MERMSVRLGVLAVLVLLAGPSLAHARPSPSVDQNKASAVDREPKLLERAWSWVVSVFEKGGSFIDPSGGGDVQNIGHPPGTVTTDGGSFIDPSGGH
jgi:hypothetical protein